MKHECEIFEQSFNDKLWVSVCCGKTVTEAELAGMEIAEAMKDMKAAFLVAMEPICLPIIRVLNRMFSFIEKKLGGN